MSQLDQIGLSIELTLISVIESLTLYFLASSSVPVLHGFGMLEYLPYAIAGFLIILIFWSQAIVHAVSFIRWPIRVGHMFLYFLAAFIQVIAYNNLIDPKRWFFWWGIFALLSAVLYWLDLRIIDDSHHAFEEFPDGKEFLAEVRRRHVYEFKTLVPSAIVFNVGLFALLYLYPEKFMNSPMNIAWLGVIQAVVCAFSLWDSVRNFKKRSRFIHDTFRKAAEVE